MHLRACQRDGGLHEHTHVYRHTGQGPLQSLRGRFAPTDATPPRPLRSTGLAMWTVSFTCELHGMEVFWEGSEYEEQA